MVMTGIRTRYNRGETDQQIDDYVAAALPTISERYRPQIINYADTLIVRDFLLEAQELVAQGATAPVMTEIIQAWVATGRVALRRGELVVLNVERMIQAREWRARSCSRVLTSAAARHSWQPTARTCTPQRFQSR
jgi:hypothetical protein